MNRIAQVMVVIALSLLADGNTAYAPVVVHLRSAVFGLHVNDAVTTARQYWATYEQGKTPFTLVHDDYVAAPFGQAVSPAVSIANGFQPLFDLATRGVLGDLGALNAYMLLGIAASLASMFWLLRGFALHPVAAAAGAVGFASSQWSIEQLSYGHPAFAQMWVFPAFVGTALWAARGSYARVVVPAFFVALSFYVVAYLGLFVSSVGALLAVIWLARIRPDRRGLVRLPLGMGIATIFLAPVIFAQELAPSTRLGIPALTRSGLFGASPKTSSSIGDHRCMAESSAAYSVRVTARTSISSGTHSWLSRSRLSFW